VSVFVNGVTNTLLVSALCAGAIVLIRDAYLIVRDAHRAGLSLQFRALGWLIASVLVAWGVALVLAAWVHVSVARGEGAS